MTIDTIRYIDRILVKLLRNILILISGKSKTLPRTPQPGERILVMKFWGLGNIIQAAPTLKLIRQTFSDSQVTFLTLSQNLGLYDHNGLYNRAISLPLKGFLPFAWEVIKLVFRLRAEHFHWVIDLDPLTYFSESLSRLSGSPNRVGFVKRLDRRSLYTHPVEFVENEHIRNTFRSIALSLGAESGDGQLIPIIVNQEESEFLNTFFRDHDLNDDHFLVGINVNASEVARERRWPQERFAELADRIAGNQNCRIILLGSPAEKEYVEDVAQIMTYTPIIAAGKTTLHQMIALLNCLNLFISNDSGPVHMACAQGTPTIAIFGPESPERYGPIGDQHRTVYLGLPCSPCISFHNAKKVQCPNPNPLCIYDITTDQIWAVVHPYLPAPTAATKASSSYI